MAQIETSLIQQALADLSISDKLSNFQKNEVSDSSIQGALYVARSPLLLLFAFTFFYARSSTFNAALAGAALTLWPRSRAYSIPALRPAGCPPSWKHSRRQ
jgi:hypothetical protein